MGDMTLHDAIELFVEVGFEVWMDGARETQRRGAEERKQMEARAKMRARLAKCQTLLQRVHEIDARQDLLRVSPEFKGRANCLKQLERLRRGVLKQVQQQ